MSHVELFVNRSRRAIIEHCTRLLAKANLPENERERLQRILTQAEATDEGNRAA